MKKYRKYVKEKYNREILETDNGFIEYECFPDGSMYVYILYVDEEARNKGEAKELEKKLIEKEKPTIIFCDVDKDSNGWDIALFQLTKLGGYEIFEETEDVVVLCKEY